MPRAPKGVFRRGTSWYVRLRRGGRDRWVSLGTDYQEACRRLRALRRSDTNPDRRVSEDKVTVSDAAKRWLELRIATARNAAGRELAKARERMYLTPYLGSRVLGTVTSDDLRRYRLWLERKEFALAPQSVAHILADARCFFRWCEESGLVDRAPIPRKLLPRIQEQPPERLTEDELARLCSLPEPYGFSIRLGLGTGLRWSELIRAQAALVEQGMLVVSRTKSGRVRRVPLSPELLREVRRRVGRLVPFGHTQYGAFLRAVRRLSRVERFRPHLLRHTFACRWLEEGGNLAALQLILGHASISTTQRYARLTDEVVRQEAARLHAGRAVAETVAAVISDESLDLNPEKTVAETVAEDLDGRASGSAIFSRHNV